MTGQADMSKSLDEAQAAFKEEQRVKFGGDRGGGKTDKLPTRTREEAEAYANELIANMKPGEVVMDAAGDRFVMSPYGKLVKDTRSRKQRRREAATNTGFHLKMGMK